MFETLRLSHGAAILKEVQRVKDVDQKRVFGEMHEGEFLGALQLADKAGRLHWTDKQPDTVRAMTEAYARDVNADPSKHRFMFAFTNAEVDALNDFARAIFKQRGDLGASPNDFMPSTIASIAYANRVFGNLGSDRIP